MVGCWPGGRLAGRAGGPGVGLGAGAWLATGGGQYWLLLLLLLGAWRPVVVVRQWAGRAGRASGLAGGQCASRASGAWRWLAWCCCCWRWLAGGKWRGGQLADECWLAGDGGAWQMLADGWLAHGGASRRLALAGWRRWRRAGRAAWPGGRALGLALALARRGWRARQGGAGKQAACWRRLAGVGLMTSTNDWVVERGVYVAMRDIRRCASVVTGT